MNKIFKECLETGIINKEPVILESDYAQNGVKGYLYGQDGFNVTQQRWDAYVDAMKRYDAFYLDHADVDQFLSIQEANWEKVLQYANDFNSLQKIVNEGLRTIREINLRRELSVPIRKMYEMASFAIIEEEENPLVYDVKYNEQKIDRWIKDPLIQKKIPFLPIAIPYFKGLESLLQMDSLNFIRQDNLLKAADIRLRIASNSSSLVGLSKEMITTMQSQMETLLGYENFYAEVWRSFTDGTQQDTDENLNNDNQSNLEIVR